MQRLNDMNVGVANHRYVKVSLGARRKKKILPGNYSVVSFMHVEYFFIIQKSQRVCAKPPING